MTGRREAQDARLRRVLVLRMLVLAWVHDPRASWGLLAAAAVENGAQYDPPVKRRELTALRTCTIEELFDPEAVARRQADPRTRTT